MSNYAKRYLWLFAAFCCGGVLFLSGGQTEMGLISFAAAFIYIPIKIMIDRRSRDEKSDD